MSPIIKNSTKFVSVQGNLAHEKLRQNVAPPNRTPQNSSKPVLRQGIRKDANVFLQESYETVASASEPKVPEQVLDENELKRRAVIKECEELKEQCMADIKRIEEQARNEAEMLLAKAGEEATAIREEARTACEELKAEAEKNGFADGQEKGYRSGEDKGFEDGYNKGLLKCKDTLKELMRLIEETAQIKEKLFNDHEHELFDAIFTISNKVTADSLKQKDKAVIRNILRETAKSFRHSEFIKVTLSKLDVEEMGNAELDALRCIFRENQHIEFEIIKDAPEGTLIVDNGTEISDAGIATQLKMIENLGKGKFRDKNAEE